MCLLVCRLGPARRVVCERRQVGPRRVLGQAKIKPRPCKGHLVSVTHQHRTHNPRIVTDKPLNACGVCCPSAPTTCKERLITDTKPHSEHGEHTASHATRHVNNRINPDKLLGKPKQLEGRDGYGHCDEHRCRDHIPRPGISSQQSEADEERHRQCNHHYRAQDVRSARGPTLRIKAGNATAIGNRAERIARTLRARIVERDSEGPPACIGLCGDVQARASYGKRLPKRCAVPDHR